MQPFNELHRPQYHFTPAAHWMNDPNGLVYYDGEYHLFYQYHPDSSVWGPMHWGHAVSKNLMKWSHLDTALCPDDLGYIFSGSVIMDLENTSELGSKRSPPMIAFFTHHAPADKKKGRHKALETQSIAFSVDKGRTWTKYENNPILSNPGIDDFRDPKVIWDESFNQWVMVLSAHDRIKFYTSNNLINWSYVSDFGPHQGTQGFPWECPDIFPLLVKETSITMWILLVSVQNSGPNGGTATQYFIGDWDGVKFNNTNPANDSLWIDTGKDNYAGVTWSNIPHKDGRKLFIGWMSNWQYAEVVPTEVWRSAMTLPRELTLNETKAGLRVFSKPVSEARTIRKKTFLIPSQNIIGQIYLDKINESNEGLLEIELEFVRTEKYTCEIILSNEQQEQITIGFDPILNTFYIDRTKLDTAEFSEHFSGTHHSIPLEYCNPALKFWIFLDHSSVELFADDGRNVMTDIFFAKTPLNKFRIVGPKQGVLLTQGTVHTLQRTW